MNRRSFIKGLAALTGIPAVLAGIVKGGSLSNFLPLKGGVPRRKGTNYPVGVRRSGTKYIGPTFTTGPHWDAKVHIEPVESVANFGNNIFLATEDGVYEIVGDKVVKLPINYSAPYGPKNKEKCKFHGGLTFKSPHA